MSLTFKQPKLNSRVPSTRWNGNGPSHSASTPLLREGVAIGAIHIRRREMRPFSDRQIKLLETFADQAVIAIENARLIHEQQARNRKTYRGGAPNNRRPRARFLRVIASSPTDLQPVLDAVAENAARVCGANDSMIRLVDGDVLAVVAHYGQIPHMSEADSTTLSRGSVSGRAVIDRQTIHIYDLAAEAKDEFPVGVALAQRFGYRTTLVAPLMRQDLPIGAIIIRRMEVRPFTDKRIDLLKTFADRRSSPSRTCGCSKSSKSATQNYARPWNIRRQRPRCSASSAARRRTCSRSSTPSSRAPPGFVGIDDGNNATSARVTTWSRGPHFGPIPTVRVEFHEYRMSLTPALD